VPHADALYRRLSELMFGTDFSTNPVTPDEDADGTLDADDRGDGDAPEQQVPPPDSSGRRHDTQPIPRVRDH